MVGLLGETPPAEAEAALMVDDGVARVDTLLDDAVPSLVAPLSKQSMVVGAVEVKWVRSGVLVMGRESWLLFLGRCRRTLHYVNQTLLVLRCSPRG